VLDGEGRRFPPIGDIELGEEVGHVGACRARADKELRDDLDYATGAASSGTNPVSGRSLARSCTSIRTAGSVVGLWAVCTIVSSKTITSPGVEVTRLNRRGIEGLS
jgi:hypothetical protein